MRPGTTLLFAALAVTACVPGGGDDGGTGGGGDDGDRGGGVITITVSAATSLDDAFTEIGDGFTLAHPGVEVTFTFASSAALATQIIEGAPADVYAPADEASMARLTDQGLVAGPPENFARNELVVVTKPGNPEGIEALADLAGAGVISLCGEDVPCGRYATEALDAAGVTIDESSVTRGQNAGATLTAVSEGDAVAGIVYVTDAAAAGDRVEAIALPDDVSPIATYPIAVLHAAGEAEAPRAEAARSFVAYVLGDEGQAVLADHGFLPAPRDGQP